MIRKDREVTERSRILEIMRRCHVCRLAFNDPEGGYPYIVPMNFGLIEEPTGALLLTFHCTHRGRKLELIAADPRCTFEVECGVELLFNPSYGHNTDVFQSVVGHGHVEMVTDPAEKLRCLQALMDRYHTAHIAATPSDAAKCTIFILRVDSLVGKIKTVKSGAQPPI